MLAIWYLVEFFSHHQIWPKSGKKYSSFAQVCLILVILKLLLSVLPDLVLYYLLQVLTFIDHTWEPCVISTTTTLQFFRCHLSFPTQIKRVQGNAQWAKNVNIVLQWINNVCVDPLWDCSIQKISSFEVVNSKYGFSELQIFLSGF